MYKPAKQGLRKLWEDAYALERDRALWGDAPLPFVAQSGVLLAQHERGFMLDLGCGDGRNTAALCQEVRGVVGVDLSAKALQLCSKRLRRMAITNAILLEASAFALPFANASFSSVFCANLIGQLSDYRRVLSEILRVTTRDAIIIMNVLSTNDPGYVFRPDDATDLSDLYGEGFYYRYFDKDSMGELIAAMHPCHVLFMREVSWIDPPHEGYREKQHQHKSWVMAVKRSIAMPAHSSTSPPSA